MDEAIEFTNSNPYGNGTAVFTSNGAGKTKCYQYYVYYQTMSKFIFSAENFKSDTIQPRVDNLFFQIFFFHPKSQKISRILSFTRCQTQRT